VEPGFLVPCPWASGVHTQPPVELPASTTMEGGQDNTSRPPSPFSFPSPTPGDPFSQTHLLLFRRILIAALIRVCFPFSAHEVSSPEIAQDDIIADSPAPADIVLSEFCTDLTVAGLCASFSVLLNSSCLYSHLDALILQTLRPTSMTWRRHID
jgi:hypothetical protein